MMSHFGLNFFNFLSQFSSNVLRNIYVCFVTLVGATVFNPPPPLLPPGFSEPPKSPILGLRHKECFLWCPFFSLQILYSVSTKSRCLQSTLQSVYILYPYFFSLLHELSWFYHLILQIDDASNIKNTDIAKELCLPPVKLHCSSTVLFYKKKLKNIYLLQSSFVYNCQNWKFSCLCLSWS